MSNRACQDWIKTTQHALAPGETRAVTAVKRESVPADYRHYVSYMENQVANHSESRVDARLWCVLST